MSFSLYVYINQSINQSINIIRVHRAHCICIIFYMHNILTRLLNQGEISLMAAIMKANIVIFMHARIMANMSKWRILMNAVNKTLVKKAHYLKRNSLLSREIVLSSRYYHSSIPWEDLKTFHAVKIDLMEAMRNGWVPLENEHFSLELEST